MIHDRQTAQISQKQDKRNIYVQSWKQCAHPVITTMALWQLMHLRTWCTWCTSCSIMVISIWHKLIRFSLFRNPAIQRMGNTRNILHPRCMEQDETHLHFMFYCKLSKITPHYISELINLNYSFNLAFKFSVKTIKMGSFSILWCCKFKKPTHTFRRDTHGSLQSLSWRWIW